MNYNTALKTAKLSLVNTTIGASCNAILYSGPMPAALGALSGNTALAEFTGATGSFGTVAATGVGTGVTLTAGAGNFASGVTPLAAGTASFLRILNGTTPVVDLTVGLSGSGADVILNSLNVTTTAVSISSIVITAGN